VAHSSIMLNCRVTARKRLIWCQRLWQHRSASHCCCAHPPNPN
jgi:hypothetical protein